MNNMFLINGHAQAWKANSRDDRMAQEIFSLLKGGGLKMDILISMERAILVPGLNGNSFRPGACIKDFGR